MGLIADLRIGATGTEMSKDGTSYRHNLYLYFEYGCGYSKTVANLKWVICINGWQPLKCKGKDCFAGAVDPVDCRDPMPR